MIPNKSIMTSYTNASYFRHIPISVILDLTRCLIVKTILLYMLLANVSRMHAFNYRVSEIDARFIS